MEKINPVGASVSTRRPGERAADNLDGAFERSEDERDRAQQWAQAMAAVMLMQQPNRMAPSGMSTLSWRQAQGGGRQVDAANDTQAVLARQQPSTSGGDESAAGNDDRGNAQVAIVTDPVREAAASAEMSGGGRQAAPRGGATMAGTAGTAGISGATAASGVIRMVGVARADGATRSGITAAIKGLRGARVGTMVVKDHAGPGADDTLRMLLRKRSAVSDAQRETASGAGGVGATMREPASEKAAAHHAPRQSRAALPLHLLQSLQAAPTCTGWTYQFRSWKGEHAVTVTTAAGREASGFALHPGSELVEQRLRDHDAGPEQHYRIDSCAADGRRRPGGAQAGPPERSERPRSSGHEDLA